MTRDSGKGGDSPFHRGRSSRSCQFAEREVTRPCEGIASPRSCAWGARARPVARMRAAHQRTRRTVVRCHHHCHLIRLRARSSRLVAATADWCPMMDFLVQLVQTSRAPILLTRRRRLRGVKREKRTEEVQHIPKENKIRIDKRAQATTSTRSSRSLPRSTQRRLPLQRGPADDGRGGRE